MPVTVQDAPPWSTSTLMPLGTVSVVMMARAARPQCAASSDSISAGTACSNFATGSGSPMTPVEKGSTCDASQPAAAATRAQQASASRRPLSPVPALALPELISR